jgi:hypothetical protein
MVLMAVGTTLMTTPLLSLIDRKREDEGLQTTREAVSLTQ